MSPDSNPQVLTDVSVDPFVRGLLHRPTNPNGDGLVLTHGAGSNCQSPLLIALAETFADAGFIVLRCDLPYRQDRPYGPPGPGDGKRDRAAKASRERPCICRRPLLRRTTGQHALRRDCREISRRGCETGCRPALAVLPAASAAQARAASHAAFFLPAHSEFVCPGHARSLRFDRR